jgi:peptidoglycan/xylan/chitin deacetylase (PgdA/CDA1 family)
MVSLTNEQAFAELYYSKKAIHDVLGITVQCWRAPYGVSITSVDFWFQWLTFNDRVYFRMLMYVFATVRLTSTRVVLTTINVEQDRIRFIASRLGMATILWDNDTDDWEIAEKGPTIAQNNYVSLTSFSVFEKKNDMS